MKTFDGEVRDTLDQRVYAFKNNEVLKSFDAPKINLLKEKLDYLSMSPTEKRAYEEYMGKLVS